MYADEVRAKIVLDQDKVYQGPRKLLPMYLATHLDITFRLGRGKPMKGNIEFLKNLVLMSKGGLKEISDGEILYVNQKDYDFNQCKQRMTAYKRLPKVRLELIDGMISKELCEALDESSAFLLRARYLDELILRNIVPGQHK